mgnify:CR=1 FL=1
MRHVQVRYVGLWMLQFVLGNEMMPEEDVKLSAVVWRARPCQGAIHIAGRIPRACVGVDIQRDRDRARPVHSSDLGAASCKPMTKN